MAARQIKGQPYAAKTRENSCPATICVHLWQSGQSVVPSWPSVNYAKQTQFQNRQYKHKCGTNKGLCQRTTNNEQQTLPKTNPIKPKTRVLLDPEQSRRANQTQNSHRRDEILPWATCGEQGRTKSKDMNYEQWTTNHPPRTMNYQPPATNQTRKPDSRNTWTFVGRVLKYLLNYLSDFWRQALLPAENFLPHNRLRRSPSTTHSPLTMHYEPWTTNQLISCLPQADKSERIVL